MPARKNYARAKKAHKEQFANYPAANLAELDARARSLLKDNGCELPKRGNRAARQPLGDEPPRVVTQAANLIDAIAFLIPHCPEHGGLIAAAFEAGVLATEMQLTPWLKKADSFSRKDKKPKHDRNMKIVGLKDKQQMTYQEISLWFEERGIKILPKAVEAAYRRKKDDIAKDKSLQIDL